MAKQLVTINQDNEIKEIFPKILMEDVIDKDTKENIYSYLAKFNHINVGEVDSQANAYAAIPPIFRKAGFYISYSIDGKAFTQFFTGSDNLIDEQWTDPTYWDMHDGVAYVASNSITLEQLSQEVLDLITSSSEITITNYPDGEDLSQQATTNSMPDGRNAVFVLKFADKTYNKANFTGLGRVYLRKNIVNDVNVLTQNMLSSSNTRYVLQYDYDLQGETVTVPENCVIDFQGGGISNGEIVGQDTWSTGVKHGTDIVYSGTWFEFATHADLDNVSGNVDDKIADLKDDLGDLKTLVEEGLYPLNVSISGTTVYEYTGNAVSMSATYSIDRNGYTVGTLDSVDITLGGTSVYSATNTTVTSGTVTGSKTDQGSYTWSITAVQGNLNDTASFSARIIAPMYFGFSSATSASSLNVLGLTKQTVRTSVSGTYSLTNSTDGYYMWLCVPSSLTISSVTMDGFAVPLEDASTVSTTLGSYRCYRSSNALVAGSYTITVS